MLTSGAAHPFHARLDLPRTAGERREAAESLLGPARRHRVTRVLFVLYAADAVRRPVLRPRPGAPVPPRRGRGGGRAAQRRRPVVPALPRRLGARRPRHALRRHGAISSPRRRWPPGRVDPGVARRAGGDRRGRPGAPGRGGRRGGRARAPRAGPRTRPRGCRGWWRGSSRTAPPPDRRPGPPAAGPRRAGRARRRHGRPHPRRRPSAGCRSSRRWSGAAPRRAGRARGARCSGSLRVAVGRRRARLVRAGPGGRGRPAVHAWPTAVSDALELALPPDVWVRR